MKRLFLISFIVFLSFSAASAQRNPVPAPTPIVEDPQRQQGLTRQADINRRSNELRMNESFPVKTEAEAMTFREKIYPLYRDPTKDELQIVAPDVEIEKTYAEFLRQKHTGLIRLFPDKNCGDAKIIVAAPECTKYTMPGSAASYSFRTETYRIRHLGDVNYTGKNFRAFGTMAHGIFVSLGDVPIEKIDLKSAGVEFLANFQAANDFKEAGEIAGKLDAGIKDGNYTYKNLLPVTENTTYALRSIAYQGTVPRTIQGVSYNELDVDKRRDVIIVFRIVRRDADGSVTILWKELSNKNAPKLKENK